MRLKSRQAMTVFGGACLIAVSLGWTTYIHDVEISKRSQLLEQARKLRKLAHNIVSYLTENGEYPAKVSLDEAPSESGEIPSRSAGVEYEIVTGRNGHQFFILRSKPDQPQRAPSLGLPSAEAGNSRSPKDLARVVSVEEHGLLQLKTGPAADKLLLAPNCFFDQSNPFEFQDEPADTVIGDAGHIVCISSSRYRGKVCEEFAVLQGRVRIVAGSESRDIGPGDILILIP
ncbi:MAG: hypothetical protein O2857_16870 [Planctomycetota bacterium]|nr:hypothetical protein [Planctomycetota bacterium]